MKKVFLIIILGSIIGGLQAQNAKRPTIMVMPSDNWMSTHGYCIQSDNMGTVETTFDYEKALRESNDLVNAIAKIGEMMQKYDYPLNNLNATLKSIANNRMEDATSEHALKLSQKDLIRQHAKADILLYLSWDIEPNGVERVLNFTLNAVDPYNSNEVATVKGHGRPSMSSSLSIMLEKAVISYIPTFSENLQKYFDNMLANGRQVVVQITVAQDAGYTLSSKRQGKFLRSFITDWVKDHAVNGIFSQEYTSNRLILKDLRIPLLKDGKPYSASDWAEELVSMLYKMGLASDMSAPGNNQVDITLTGKAEDEVDEF